MRSFVDRLRALQGRDGVLSLSLIHGFMAADVPEMGTQMLAIIDGDAEKAADRWTLGMEIFALRGQTAMPMLGIDAGLDAALKLAARKTGRPAVVADVWDNPGGGVVGDGTLILRRMLERGMDNFAVATIWDPIAVIFCRAAGEGEAFAPVVTYNLGNNYGPASVIAADVTGDGKVDLVSADYAYNPAGILSVFTNNGSGGFALASSPTASVGSFAQSVAAADVNGDGKLDLISANSGDGSGNTLSVLTNNGNGGFTLQSTLIVGKSPWSVIAVDVNGDGKPDLICANQSDGTLSVLTNDGNGGFPTVATYTVGSYPYSVIAADVNGDGRMDLICANAGDSTLSVLTNNGRGGFVTSGTYHVGSYPMSVTAADVNGDGKVDLICANHDGNTLSVLTNDGRGGFKLASSPPVGNGPWSVTAADVNGDGWVDLICANYFTNTLSVLTNDGAGGFATASTLTVGNYPVSVTAADVNGDGRSDLICAASGAISVFVNTAPFTPSAWLRVEISPPAAISAGAQWQVDGGDWENSGSTVYRLPGGSHTVAFSSVAGWITPSNQTVILSTNETITAIGTYPQEFSSLAGNSFGVAITSGIYPFASSGYFLFLPASTGSNYEVTGIHNVMDSSGTYAYWRAGALGTAYLTDSIAGSIVGNFSFTNADTGSYFVTNAGALAYQAGDFEEFSGQVPTSVAGKIVECTVLTGLYPLANTGTFTLKIANSANTYKVIGDGTNTVNSAGNYSYSEINGTTGAMQVSDSVSGSSTVYLAFSSSNTGGYAIKSLLTGGFQIGHFVTTDTGSLQISISPGAAVAAGAGWQVDGGALQNSGATVSNLPVGNHTVSFRTLTGGRTPSNQILAVGVNSTATASGTYVPIGSLQVTIGPAGAIPAGAQWQVDLGAWQNSGATVTNLAVGNHTVSFNTIGGWTTPTNQNRFHQRQFIRKSQWHLHPAIRVSKSDHPSRICNHRRGEMAGGWGEVGE